MPEHPEAPDRMLVVVTPDGTLLLPGQSMPMGKHRYLRSTPARLAAEQMLEALKVIEDQVAAGEAPDYDTIHEAIAAAQGGEDG